MEINKYISKYTALLVFLLIGAATVGTLWDALNGFADNLTAKGSTISGALLDPTTVMGVLLAIAFFTVILKSIQSFSGGSGKRY